MYMVQTYFSLLLCTRYMRMIQSTGILLPRGGLATPRGTAEQGDSRADPSLCADACAKTISLRTQTETGEYALYEVSHAYAWYTIIKKNTYEFLVTCLHVSMSPFSVHKRACVHACVRACSRGPGSKRRKLSCSRRGTSERESVRSVINSFSRTAVPLWRQTTFLGFPGG